MYQQFLLCSTVFNRKQFTVVDFAKEENPADKINYLLTNRQDAVLWPLFVKSDIEEVLPMDPSLSSILRGLVVGSDTCRMRYNGWIYQIEEIAPSSVIPGYWKCMTNCGSRLFDPECIQFIGSTPL
jgi:hypothetical protein